MNKRTGILAGLIALLIAVAGYFYFSAKEQAPKPPAADMNTAAPAPEPQPPVQVSAPSPPEPPPILHPIETLPSADPLPDLSHSDVPFRQSLGGILGKKGLALVLSDDLIYHLVVTLDNLPRKHLPASVVPLQRAAGPFAVDGQGEARTIAASNAKRYAAFIAVAKNLDADALVALYRRYYPLFQQAYKELGYPDGNFNDRLVAVIDDLLAAPDPEPPIRLDQPKILFQYADPNLENRSAGQKIMMRIGRNNAAVLKQKLTEIRRLVAR